MGNRLLIDRGRIVTVPGAPKEVAMKYTVWQFVSGTRSLTVEIPDEEVEKMTEEELEEEIYSRADPLEWTDWETDDIYDSGWDEA
jgi:hypothetical protein